MFVPVDRIKKQTGRGALSNPSGRFEQTRYTEAEDNEWGLLDQEEEQDERSPLPTVLHVDTARTILTKNDSPDIPFTYSINPYRGCEHGCVYCYARPSHSYWGLSPGMDFETQLFYKPQAAVRLRMELDKPSHRCSPIAMGANTDAYQPVERTKKITRGLLEVLWDYRHPVSLITKSALIQRDVDVLAPMASRKLALVCISLTTLNPKLARTLEPRAATPTMRLQTIRRLSEAGIPVIVLTSPMIPGLNDHELEHLLEAAREAGARGAGYTLVRLAYELKDLFSEWLHKHQPERAQHVLSLIRQCHKGALYQSGFGLRQRGEGPYAELLQQRFDKAYKRLGFGVDDLRLDCGQFRLPTDRQLGFFDQEIP